MYRGMRGSLPPDAYVYGDICSREILMLKDGVQTVLLDAISDLVGIYSFGEDEAGEIYVVDGDGVVYRIANPDAITLTLTLNETAFRPGETLAAGLIEANPGPATAVDGYLGAFLPPRAGPAFSCPGGDAVAFIADGGARVEVTCLSTPPFRPSPGTSRSRRAAIDREAESLQYDLAFGRAGRDLSGVHRVRARRGHDALRRDRGRHAKSRIHAVRTGRAATVLPRR